MLERFPWFFELNYFSLLVFCYCWRVGLFIWWRVLELSEKRIERRCGRRRKKSIFCFGSESIVINMMKGVEMMEEGGQKRKISTISLRQIILRVFTINLLQLLLKLIENPQIGPHSSKLNQSYLFRWQKKQR